MQKQIASVVMMAVVLCGIRASAQEQRVEVSANIGQAFSDGVSGNAIKAADGNVYNHANAKNSARWAFTAAINATEHVQFGFVFGQQISTVQISGTATRDVGDLAVRTYHGFTAYNLFSSGARIRPYVMAGVGATYFGPLTFSTSSTGPVTIPSNTRWSPTFGAGTKIFLTHNIGLRSGIQWTPTRIDSESSGWWCDPSWGCRAGGGSHYANQIAVSSGVLIRF